MDKVVLNIRGVRVKKLMTVDNIVSTKGVKEGVVWLSSTVCRLVKLGEQGKVWYG